jgi:hypothetical protein
MTVLSVIGILSGAATVQRLSLPKLRLFAGLAAIGLIITGIDLLAVLELPQRSDASTVHWLRFVAGLLMGFGIGYFVRWIRFSLSRRQRYTAEVVPIRRRHKRH